jgi:hypothetical protein
MFNYVCILSAPEPLHIYMYADREKYQVETHHKLIRYFTLIMIRARAATAILYFSIDRMCISSSQYLCIR